MQTATSHTEPNGAGGVWGSPCLVVRNTGAEDFQPGKPVPLRTCQHLVPPRPGCFSSLYFIHKRQVLPRPWQHQRRRTVLASLQQNDLKWLVLEYIQSTHTSCRCPCDQSRRISSSHLKAKGLGQYIVQNLTLVLSHPRRMRSASEFKDSIQLNYGNNLHK